MWYLFHLHFFSPVSFPLPLSNFCYSSIFSFAFNALFCNDIFRILTISLLEKLAIQKALAVV